MPARKGARDRSRKPSRAHSKRSPSGKRVSNKQVPAPKRGKKSAPPKPVRAQRPTFTQRPGAWWREPIDKRKLSGLGEDEARFLVEQERLLKTELLKEQIRTLRQYSTEFDAADGYPLTTSELIRIPATKLRKLRRAHESLQRAKSQPNVEISARTKKQKKTAKQRAGEIIPGQKRFLIHHGDAAKAKAVWKDGEIEIKTTVKGGEIYERIYYFPRRPRTWGDVKRMTADLQRRGMRTGIYKVFNTLYGPIGQPVQLSKLQEALEDFFGTYSKWLAGTILGWIWIGTSIDSSLKRERRRLAAAERFKMTREFKAYKERRRIEERLGRAKRCKKCKRKRCVCKAPEFK